MSLDAIPSIHCHSWQTTTGSLKNRSFRTKEARQALIPDVPFKTFSYPLSPPRASTKRMTGTRFTGCRGGGQTFNVGTTDLNYLAAYFLEKSVGSPGAVEELIEQNRRACGWLILATHDVAPEPTQYGCTPAFFEEVVRTAVGSGVRIVPVGTALEILRRPPLRPCTMLETAATTSGRLRSATTTRLAQRCAF